MKTTKCKACQKEIVFLGTRSGKTMPVDVDSLPPVDKRSITENIPVEFDAKRGHISHFATCPEANSFRRKKKNN